MAKTNEEILEAVRALDPNDNEHWTADGLPRLDAVENMLGGDVNRKAVTNAAPDFTRQVALSLVDADGEPPVDDPTLDDNDAEDADDTDDTDAELQSTPEQDTPPAGTSTDNDDDDEAGADDPLAEGPADMEASMEADILEAQEKVEAIRVALEKGRKALAEAEEDLGVLVDQKNRAFPPMSHAEAIQRFQRNELAKRAAARGVSVSSPLDASLAARKKARSRGAALGARKPSDSKE